MASKKKATSSAEKYQNRTLDDLIGLENFDDDDEEIDEEAAFNSDDEQRFGKYFPSSASEAPTWQRNLCLSVDLPETRSNDVTATIARGSKMTLSSVCLDVSRDFDQVQLLFKCTLPDETAEEVGGFRCLCNYLGAGRGGNGPPPSTPMPLEVHGPCTVEFRAKTTGAVVTGAINIFGVIVPAGQFNNVDGTPRHVNAHMSEEERVETKKDIPTNAPCNATKKRKLEDDLPQKSPTAAPAEPGAPAAKGASTDNTLSKSARKKLAKEKAKQLEETLAAARQDTENGARSHKKKRKKQQRETEAPKPLTRERRLAGGVVVSDVLVGTGREVKPGKRISLHYTGSLRSTGKVFDKNASLQHPLVFRQGTGEVLRGLERGLEGMKAGGQRVIHIPSQLGYGAKGSGDEIPPDSDLSFEVKVLKVG